MIYADRTGQVFDHPDLRMAVWDGYSLREPTIEELIPMPSGSDLFVLPGRAPLGFSGKRSHLVEFAETPDGPTQAVSVFLAPAYLRLAHPAYRTLPDAAPLPLFAYSAVGWADGRFWTTTLRIDPERRQDPNLFDESKIRNGIDRDLAKLPDNRLLKQLQRCALEYGCRAAQNLFLKRWEAPLPTSRSCNAQCFGCISKQNGPVLANHERLAFVPTPQEVFEVTDLHFSRVENPIASFGQGCEGEPLTQWKVLLESVELIRKKYPKGTINLNTNASIPEAVEMLCQAGLSSIRVSIASPTRELYDRYHNPSGYSFDDVLDSLRIAKRMGKFISLNLLVFPGVTDRQDEFANLLEFLDEYDIDMIQWRNLNVDPEQYMGLMGTGPMGDGLMAVIEKLKTLRPKLLHGYFNPFVG